MRVVVYFLLGTILGLGVRDWMRGSMMSSRPALVPPAPTRRRITAHAAPDPLVELIGIGPVFEELLHDAGIRTFADLAAQDADALAERLGGRVPAERIRRERWIEQARERADE